MRVNVGGGVLRYIETLCHFRRHVLLPQAGVMTDGDRHQAEGREESPVVFEDRSRGGQALLQLPTFISALPRFLWLMEG